MSQANKLQFAFFGTPDVARKTLALLEACGYIPSVIITSPDAPAGRGMHMTESPVSIWAKEKNIPCVKPEKIDQEFLDTIKKLGIEISIVVAYGKILPQTLIDIPTLGTINIHYSLLPKYRGASPLEATLLAGDKITGVSIQKMAYKLDSGPILAEKEIQIDIQDTKESLREKLINLGGNLLCEILHTPSASGTSPFEEGGIPQDESKATYCSKIKKEDGEIDLFNATNARQNYNKYRAFFGWPGVFFFANGKRIKITKARFENEAFIIEKVIPEGKKEMDYTVFNTST
jgi:methionyl-tRNA formyltransferase